VEDTENQKKIKLAEQKFF